MNRHFVPTPLGVVAPLMLALVWGLFSGCRVSPDRDSGTVPVPSVDGDADGFDSPADCDDEDPAVNPWAEEVCNALDDDCDGNVDEGEVYADRDGDGYGDSTTTLATICVGEGTAAAGGDCDDVDPGVYPGAEEACDGADANCDGARSTCWLEDVAEWTFLEFDPDHSDGSIVSLAGDVDGDGLADILVGGGMGWIRLDDRRPGGPSTPLSWRRTWIRGALPARRG